MGREQFLDFGRNGQAEQSGEVRDRGLYLLSGSPQVEHRQVWIESSPLGYWCFPPASAVLRAFICSTSTMPPPPSSPLPLSTLSIVIFSSPYSPPGLTLSQEIHAPTIRSQVFTRDCSLRSASTPHECTQTVTA